MLSFLGTWIAVTRDWRLFQKHNKGDERSCSCHLSQLDHASMRKIKLIRSHQDSTQSVSCSSHYCCNQAVKPLFPGHLFPFRVRTRYLVPLPLILRFRMNPWTLFSFFTALDLLLKAPWKHSFFPHLALAIGHRQNESSNSYQDDHNPESGTGFAHVTIWQLSE